VYDATTTASLSGTAGLSGMLNGDSVTLGGSYTASFGDKNVGTGKTVTATGFNITGTDAGNYSITQPTGLMANITPKALTITGLSGVNRVYDATTTASLSGTATLSGLEGSDSVTLGGIVLANFENANVGTNKGITVSGYTVDNSNYSITQPTGLMADILPQSFDNSTLIVSQAPIERLGYNNRYNDYKMIVYRKKRPFKYNKLILNR
jgi:hypothetical protein